LIRLPTLARRLAVLVIIALVAATIITLRSPGNPDGPTPSPSQTAPEALQTFYSQKPIWSPCGEGFECTTILVPADYTNPAGATFTLALNRLQAVDPGAKIGSLLVNPGGPGGSGLDYARAASQIVSPSILQRFDIVGFDPRGVGESTPLRCLNDREQDEVLALDQSPDTPLEEEANLIAAKLLADRCDAKAGELLGFMSSEDVARDMDVIRAVVGDDRLYYLGKSYGTYIGAIYADLFPKKTGRLVLDGALDPTVDSRTVNLVQAKGFEVALDAFIANCAKRRDCVLGRSVDEGRARIKAFLEQVDRTPLRTDERRRLTQSLAIIGIVSTLYEQDFGWPILEDAFLEAFAGDGTLLLLLSDEYLDRDDRGRYRTNQNDIAYIVSCLDRAYTSTIEELRRDQREFGVESPIFGPFLAWSSVPCSYWPVEARPYRAPIAAKGSPPILVVGTLRDPATPYEWSQGLARQLENGFLLSWDGDGHTAYRRGSGCVDRNVDAYLLRGVTPTRGTLCK
jgi:pimeloyl-ACP methyl ester carboxylesterase